MRVFYPKCTDVVDQNSAGTIYSVLTLAIFSVVLPTLSTYDDLNAEKRNEIATHRQYQHAQKSLTKNTLPHKEKLKAKLNS